MKPTLERLFSQPPITGRDVSEVRRRPDGACTYLQGTDQEGVSDLWTCDPQTGERSRLVEGAALKAQDAEVGLGGYQWLSERTLLLAASGRAWLYHLPEARLEQLLLNVDDQVSPHPSPSRNQLAFIREGNLWLLDRATGEERALTSDGSEAVLNGKLDWVYWEELSNRKGWRAFEWSPDGQSIAFIRLDQSRVPEFPLVDAREVHPKLVRQRYPKAGDPNSTPSVRIVSAADGSLTAAVDLPDDSAYVGPELAWLPDSSAVTWTWMARSQQSLELRSLGRDGSERTLLSEADPYWLNATGPAHFLDDGSFLWISEQTGFAHLYHHSPAGELIRAVTGGDWQVEQVHWVRDGHVLFSGTGEDARERRLYRAPILTPGLEALTPESSWVSTEWPDDSDWGVTFVGSPAGPAPKRFIRADGTPGPVLWEPDPTWAEYEWADSEFIDVTAPDGTLLHGRLIKPPHFDPSQRYPVVVHVYGGPHAQTVRYTWAGSDPLDQLLAQAGVLVWKLDNRGSWGRGHAFEAAVNRRLYQQELADQLAGVEYLKSLPYVDPERIGITGWSYGGSMTLYSLTRAPQVWKCGAAGAAVTDWALYDTIYTERYMGTPSENPEGYRDVSILDGAQHLQAPLLLIHGTDDDNVHVQNTLQFIDRLAQHRKPYELLIQPGQKHGFTGQAIRTYLHERMVEFLVRNLG